MRVVLFRHGIAHDRADPKCPPDPERALTDEGKKKTRKAARGLAFLGVKPVRILTSPYLRARQTAEIAADVLGVKEPLVVTAALLPEAPPYTLFHALYAFDTDEEVLCAGHAPNLDRVLALSLGGGRAPLPSITELKKAGAACIIVDQLPRVQGTLSWLLPPKALGELPG